MKILEEKLERMQEETEIRRQLETTEEEKKDTENDVLTAAGRDYTLMKQGYLGLEYSFKYTGNTSGTSTFEQNSTHRLTNAILLEYPLKNNVTLNTNIPFEHKIVSESQSTAKDVSDLGDVSFGAQWQPFKSGGGSATKIISFSLSCPTGRSQYKIDPAKEVSTGSGGYSISTGLNLSKRIDPLVAFGSLSYAHSLPIEDLTYKINEGKNTITKVEPGNTISYSLGIGYSLSYKVSLNLSYQYSYMDKSRYTVTGAQSIESDPSISSVFSIGTGWNISPKRSLNLKLSFGLTDNDSDVSVTARVPFEIEL